MNKSIEDYKKEIMKLYSYNKNGTIAPHPIIPVNVPKLTTSNASVTISPEQINVQQQEDFPILTPENNSSVIPEQYEVPVLPDYIATKDAFDNEPIAGNTNKTENKYYTDIGKIVLQVKSADSAIPIKNATVIFERPLENGEKETIKILKTDRNGLTEEVTTEAPSEYFSESPESANSGYAVFSQYDLIVYKEGFFKEVIKNVPVFADIVTIQPVNLIPLPLYYDKSTVETIIDEESNL